MDVTIRYFALFREQSGCEGETRTFPVGARDKHLNRPGEATLTAAAVYSDAAERHGFSLDRKVLRPAVNGRYVSWDTPVADGDEVVFIPPVSGG